MVIKDYDYQNIEIRYKQINISYSHYKGRYTGGRGNTNKEITWRFKALDILLSFLSSLLSILKSVFV